VTCLQSAFKDSSGDKKATIRLTLKPLNFNMFHSFQKKIRGKMYSNFSKIPCNDY
jgi:hypothetical protein